jgi:microcystin-dependent protein
MSDAYIGEIRLMSFSVVPKGWTLCNGQLLPINQNQALFSLLGTTFGGDGTTTFALPNLQGRVPMHAGNNHERGEVGGQPQHTLILTELPQHTHVLNATNDAATETDPTNHVLGSTTDPSYKSEYQSALGAATVSPVGGGQAHLNLQPTLTISFCIALVGIFPSRE